MLAKLDKFHTELVLAAVAYTAGFGADEASYWPEEK